MQLNFLPPNSNVPIYFENGHASFRLGLQAVGHGPYAVAIRSPWLAEQLAIESVGDCEVFSTGSIPQDLEQALEHVRNHGYQDKGMPLPDHGLDGHTILAMTAPNADVRVRIDTHSARILDQQRGRKALQLSVKAVHLREPPVEGWRCETAVEVMLDIRGELPYLKQACSIDVGTTNTCAAVMKGDPPKPVLYQFRGAHQVPTIVAYDSIMGPDQRRFVLGHMAEQLEGDGSARCVRSIKRYLGAPEEQRQIQIVTAQGVRQELRVDDIYYDFIDMYLGELEKDERKKLARIKACYPPYFGPRALRAMQNAYKRRNIDSRPESLLGIDEASAAALWFTWCQLKSVRHDPQRFRAQFGSRHNMLVFDFGGGTTDIALVSTSASEEALDGWRDARLSFTVLASCTIPDLGGDNLTLEVFKALKCRIALAAATHHEGAGELAKYNSPDAAAALDELYADRVEFAKNLDAHDVPPDQYQRLVARIEKLAERVLPTAWRRIEWHLHQDTDDRLRSWNVMQAMHTSEVLFKLAEDRKKALSSEDEVGIDIDAVIGGSEKLEGIRALQLPTEAWEGIVLRRNCDLEQRIRPLVARAVRGCLEVLDKHRDPRFRLHSIQLVGNSCKVPLVREELIGGLSDVVPSVEEIVEHDLAHAKSSVALGACLGFHIKSFGGVQGYKIDIDNRNDELGWEIGEADERGWIVTLFRPTDKPGDAEVLIDDTGREEIALFRRTGGDENEKPELIGKFELDGKGESHRDLPQIPRRKLRLVLSAKTILYIQRGQAVYRFHVPGVRVKAQNDPFSGVH